MKRDKLNNCHDCLGKHYSEHSLTSRYKFFMSWKKGGGKRERERWGVKGRLAAIQPEKPLMFSWNIWCSLSFCSSSHWLVWFIWGEKWESSITTYMQEWIVVYRMDHSGLLRVCQLNKVNPNQCRCPLRSKNARTYLGLEHFRLIISQNDNNYLEYSSCIFYSSLNWT